MVSLTPCARNASGNFSVPLGGRGSVHFCGRQYIRSLSHTHLQSCDYNGHTVGLSACAQRARSGSHVQQSLRFCCNGYENFCRSDSSILTLRQQAHPLKRSVLFRSTKIECSFNALIELFLNFYLETTATTSESFFQEQIKTFILAYVIT